MNINESIDLVGKKYGYDDELISVLKRCIPAMAEGKSEEDVKLLMDTLDRVQIYTFEQQPTKEQVDAITEEKINGRNQNVKEESYDLGEYGNGVAPGAYVNQPIFDDNMNIVDRVGFLYTTNLYSQGETAKFYGTKINLSHLIHELGHAWAAQKGEFEQEENGDYTMNVGAVHYTNKVDRDKRTVVETGVSGLYVEEALNSIEEEKTLLNVLGISNLNEIPGYVRSQYLGDMSDMMKHYIEKLGVPAFEKIRIQKDKSKLGELQDVFDQTGYKEEMNTPEYYNKKREIFEKYKNTDMSDMAKQRIRGHLEKYDDLYFSAHESKDFLEHLDTVLHQMYNFKSIKYSYDIYKDEIKQVYIDTHVAMLKEGYIPVNRAADIIEKSKKQENKQVTLSSLAREALETNIRKEELSQDDNQMKKEEGEVDGPNM